IDGFSGEEGPEEIGATGSVSRRRFLAGTACALGGVLVLDRATWSASAPTGEVGSTWASGAALRPPGVRSEEELLDRCVRCGVCMQSCPTNVIQPDLSPSSAAGLFVPELALRLGGCDPECTRCGEVCPTGAIRPLEPEAKRSWVLGTAVVEDGLCLRPRGEDCRACLEVCPFDAFESPSTPGGAPRVLADRCTGCGLCEFRCPVPPRDGSRRTRRAALRPTVERRPAIRIVTTAEAPRLEPTLREPGPRDDSHLPPFLRSS
ncbi:MAG: 4Fe-4S dicluster domain-containing protein, partial [Thermoanaerobaculia bacterium]|nr:4Fe-4S dicluster domain-containing protein [Thermoanaerobaculia bacterium]